jgi:hypothetical protein
MNKDNKYNYNEEEDNEEEDIEEEDNEEDVMEEETIDDDFRALYIESYNRNILRLEQEESLNKVEIKKDTVKKIKQKKQKSISLNDFYNLTNIEEKKINQKNSCQNVF